MMKKD
ncbi:hypothetical protein CISIN_1g0402952mg, partial [Citrus sinensis]